MVTGFEVLGAIGASISALNVAIRSINSALELWEDVKEFDPKIQALGERITSIRFSLRLTLELYIVVEEEQNKKAWSNTRVLAILQESLPNAIEAARKCDEYASRLVKELPKMKRTSTTKRAWVMLRNRTKLQELENAFTQQKEVMNTWQTNLNSCIMMLVAGGVSTIGNFRMPDKTTIEHNKDKKSPLALVIPPEIQNSSAINEPNAPNPLISPLSSPVSPTSSLDSHETLITTRHRPTEYSIHLDGLENDFKNSDIFGKLNSMTAITYKQDEELEHWIRKDNELAVWNKINKIDSSEVTSWAATGIILACKHGKLRSLSCCLQAITKAPGRQEALSLLGPDGLAALHHALKKLPHQFSIQILRELLDSGANPRQQANTREGYYPMHYCIRWCKSVQAVEALAAKSSKAVNEIDSQGHTALFYAVAKTQIDLTTVLAGKLGATFGDISPPAIPARFEKEKVFARLQILQDRPDQESIDGDGRRSSTSSFMTQGSLLYQTQSSIRRPSQRTIIE